jgi:hypothetical protein
MAAETHFMRRVLCTLAYKRNEEIMRELQISQNLYNTEKI